MIENHFLLNNKTKSDFIHHQQTKNDVYSEIITTSRLPRPRGFYPIPGRSAAIWERGQGTDLSFVLSGNRLALWEQGVIVGKRLAAIGVGVKIEHGLVYRKIKLLNFTKKTWSVLRGIAGAWGSVQHIVHPLFLLAGSNGRSSSEKRVPRESATSGA